MWIIMKFKGVWIQGSNTELSNLQKYVDHEELEMSQNQFLYFDGFLLWINYSNCFHPFHCF